jgi:hypothetical protein
MRNFVTVISAGILAFGFASCQSNSVEGPAASVAQCDRQCLEGIMDQYLAAMVARDASKAPFAKTVKLTENADTISLSNATQGLWAGSTALRDYKLYVADPQAGQVAYVGVVQENDKPALLSMRLKIDNKQITEAEMIVVRNTNERNLWTMKTPPPAYSQALAPEEKVSRDELVKISNLYFDGIVKIDSSIVPWDDDCYRLENGMWTAGYKLPEALAVNMPDPSTMPKPKPKTSGSGGPPSMRRSSCAEGLDSGALAVIESITPRRTPVVDEERGVTWGVYVFNHAGVETVTLPDGRVQPAAYFAGNPNSMPISELFKITRGKIKDIMAIGVIRPYKSNSGWD